MCRGRRPRRRAPECAQREEGATCKARRGAGGEGAPLRPAPPACSGGGAPAKGRRVLNTPPPARGIPLESPTPTEGGLPRCGLHPLDPCVRVRLVRVPTCDHLPWHCSITAGPRAYQRKFLCGARSIPVIMSRILPYPSGTLPPGQQYPVGWLRHADPSTRTWRELLWPVEPIQTDRSAFSSKETSQFKLSLQESRDFFCLS